MILKILPSEGSSGLTVEVSAIVPMDDVFQVFYINNEERFNEKNSLKINVKGSSVNQKIEFELPSNIPISKLRIDIGNNRRQKSIVLNDIKLKIGGQVYEESYQSIFKPNRFIQLIDNTSRLNLNVIDNKYDPYFKSENLIDILKTLKDKKPFKYNFIIALLISLALAGYSIQLFHKNTNPPILTISFISLFFFLIVIPTLNLFLPNNKQNKSDENRNLAEMPEIGNSQFTKKFEEFVNDNFTYRKELIKIGSSIKFYIFNSSPKPEKVLIGENGWLFYNNIDALESYSHSSLYSNEKLDAIKKGLEQRTKKLQTDSIIYIVGFWPNKHSIYPENMPFIMSQQIRDTISQVDQVIEHLKKTNSTVELFDVRSSMIEKKKENILYYSLDTHWNDLGAFYGYQQIMKKKGGFENINQLSDYQLTYENRYKGDLLGMTGAQNKKKYFDKEPKLIFDNLSSHKIIPTKGLPKRSVVTLNEKAKNDHTVMAFRDSFTTALIPYYSSSFRKVIYIRTPYKQELVDKFNPDIVIDVFVERFVSERIFNQLEN